MHVTVKKKKNLVSFLRLEKVKRRWQKAVKLVIAVQRVAKITDTLRRKDQAKTFIDITEEENSRYRQTAMGTAFPDGLSLKETMLSREVCMILSTPPVYRTDEDISQVVNGLRFIREFTAYPPHVQEQLARVGWYTRVEPKRIIIRQGQPPDACYFILGGQVVVKKMKRDSTARVETILHQGACFGELALLYNIGRARTVASRTTVHLLWVLGEDFLDIFRGPRTVTNAIPKHVKYLGKLDLMKGWPLAQLYDNPSFCRTLYFRENTVIVRDSKDSQWLYIVRSGTCEVVMLVPQVRVTKRDFYRALREKISETTELKAARFDRNRNARQDTTESSYTSVPQAGGVSGTGLSGAVSPDIRQPTAGINFHGTKEKSLLFSNPILTPAPFIQSAVHQCSTPAVPSNRSLHIFPPLSNQLFVKKPLPRFRVGWPPKRTQRVLRRWHKAVSKRLQLQGDSQDMDQNTNSMLSCNHGPHPAKPTRSPRSQTQRSSCPVIDTPVTLSAGFKLQSVSEGRFDSENISALKVSREHSASASDKFVNPSSTEARCHSLYPKVHIPVSARKPLPLPTVPPSSTVVPPVLTNDPDAFRGATHSKSRGQGIRKLSKVTTKSPFSSSLAADVDVKPTKLMYVTLQELHEGDVYGLDQMPLPLYLGAPVISPSTCLISRGAECVLLHKAFFAEHAPDLLRARLAANSSEYPDPEEVTLSLRQALYHRLVLKDMLNRMVPKEWLCSSDDET